MNQACGSRGDQQNPGLDGQGGLSRIQTGLAIRTRVLHKARVALQNDPIKGN
jgi:hypothetical protein